MSAKPDNVIPLEKEARLRPIEAKRYFDPDFAELERRRVFGRAWIAITPEDQVARPGDVLCFDEVGESLLLVRDEQGQLRAFHNSCVHRGTRLVDTSGRNKQIRCPYHGWTYGLDGHLDHVPRPEGLSGSKRNTSGLRPVRTAQWMGYVWANFSDGAPPLAETMAGIDAELAPYQLESMRPIQERVFHLDVNWKAMLENATDYYHVPQVHSRTVYQHVQTQPDLQIYGDHSRQRLEIANYGWRNWVDQRCTRGGPYTDLQRRALHKYLVFPNFLINVLPYHLTVMQVFPDGPNRCRLNYRFCMRQGARGLERARAYATWLASRYILWEDLRLLSSFQRGVQTGRVARHRLHDEEAAIGHFHRVLDRWIGPEEPAAP